MPSSLQAVNIARAAKRLEKPFQLLRLLQVDDLAVDVYLCEGAVAWHRHTDEDELFMTYSGLMTLETEWGTVSLRPWELALVPKGVGHRSLSVWPSVVLVMRPVLLTDRKDGDRRLYGLPGETPLRKTSLIGAAEWPGMPFRPQFLLKIEDFSLRLLRCVGRGPWIEPRTGDTLLLVQQGTALLESEEGHLPLLGGELARVPKHLAHRLVSDTLALVLEWVCEEPRQQTLATADEWALDEE
ncbi:MAG: hypothetical protein QHJ81_07405 [Anaerolineae bacterium]|nr:hypothetical protein [Anaerolineae bacterium]